jgi:DNA-binding transcriptional MocR family regulator
MARKAIVERNTVLQLLKEGKTSQSIASQFGVSRQAIDLYRKEFVSRGLLEGKTRQRRIKKSTSEAAPQPALKPEANSLQDIPLAQMIDVLIKVSSSLKRIPELEAEVEKYHHAYEELLQEIALLEHRGKSLQI